jgi:hypothetical protein
MRSLLPLLLLPLAQPLTAQQAAIAELLSTPFGESYQPDVAVSGNVIVGVMTAGAAAGIVDNAIIVHADGAAEHATLCLRAASRDGIYTSKNLYALPAGVEGVVVLPYPSTQEDVVRQYADDEIALAATSGNCDEGTTEFYLVTGSQAQAATEVVVYVNSFGATDVLYHIDDEPSSCQYIDEGRRTTYDFICHLDGIPSGAATAVTIIRERFGREQPAVTFQLIGAAR